MKNQAFRNYSECEFRETEIRLNNDLVNVGAVLVQFSGEPCITRYLSRGFLTVIMYGIKKIFHWY